MLSTHSYVLSTADYKSYLERQEARRKEEAKKEREELLKKEQEKPVKKRKPMVIK